MNKPELKVKPIKNGTVIDHISPNKALHVLKILGLPDSETNVTITMNVESRTFGKKDILKIENRELDSKELDQVALLSPHTTINIIRDYEIVLKDKVQLMNTVVDIIDCENPNCITNSNEPVKTKFYVTSNEPLELRCYYCERILSAEDVESQF